MTQTTNYQCPSCGGPLHFDSDSQLLKCDYCDSTFLPSEIEALYNKHDTVESSSNSWTSDEQANMRAYNCSSCGADIITDENTAATSCPYCGNPTIVETRFEGSLKPDYVIPFKLKKENAVQALNDFYKGKPFIPKSFKNQNHIEEVKGLYVPFWLYDAVTEAGASYHATRVHTRRTRDEEITITEHYRLIRKGNISFEKVPADASSKMKDEYMDAIEPFHYDDLVPFQKSYMAGYYADKYDVSVENDYPRIETRMHNSAISALSSTTVGFSSVAPESEKVLFHDRKVNYAFLPVWILSTNWNNKNYLFMMNGQTGKIIGDDIPIDFKKVILTFIAIFLILFVLMFIGLGW